MMKPVLRPVLNAFPQHPTPPPLAMNLPHATAVALPNARGPDRSRAARPGYAGPVDATTCLKTSARTMLAPKSASGPAPRNAWSASSDSHSS